MSLAVTHAKVSLIADPTDPAYAGFVLPSDWDAAHTLTGVASVAQGGTGQATYTPPLSLFTCFAPASNVGTNETDLSGFSFPLPAGMLAANGNKLRVTVWGVAAANANTKTLRIYFGSTSRTVNNVTTAPNSVAWRFTVDLVRLTATTQEMITAAMVGQAAQAVARDTPSETLANAITIKVTGQSGTASADLTAIAMSVEFIP